MDHINNMNNDMKTSQRLNSHVADKTDKLTGKSVIMDAQFVPNLSNLSKLPVLTNDSFHTTLPHCSGFPCHRKTCNKIRTDKDIVAGKKKRLELIMCETE